MKLTIKNSALLGLIVSSGSAMADGFSFHLGADLGFQNMSTNVPDEASKKGFEGIFFGGALFEDGGFEVESDLGLRYSKISGTADNVLRRISFLSAHGRLAPRFKITNEWSLGPSVEALFGADVDHSEQAEASSSVAWLAGASTRVRIPDTELSFTARAVVDLNFAEQNLFVLSAGLLWHFGSSPKTETLAVETPPPAADAAYMDPLPPIPEAPRAEVEVTKSLIRLRLPEEVLLFETGMSHLSSKQRDYIGRLGAVLVTHGGRWDSLVVEGHTDYRGTVAVNQVLSQARAESVRKQFIAGGILSNRISDVGHGEAKPLATEKDAESLRRNRRVEVLIQGIEDGGDVADQLLAVNPDGATGVDPSFNSEPAVSEPVSSEPAVYADPTLNDLSY